MAIIHFINSKSQTASSLKNVLGYVSKAEKTETEDKKYVTALNCSVPTAQQEFIATKNLYHKNSGRMYYHLVQSFPKGFVIAPDLAHKIAVELAEKAFGNYECVVVTHIDREHIHSHIVFNSVSFSDGKKYISNAESVKNLIAMSDEICLKYGVPILEEPKLKKKTNAISDREYRSAVKGESYKLALMFVIDEMMKRAKSKKHFIKLMNQNGYYVRWEDNRKYITYTCPGGQKCRCKRLHEKKYSKEMMTLEFEIRLRELERIEQAGAENRNRKYGRTANENHSFTTSDSGTAGQRGYNDVAGEVSESLSFGTEKDSGTGGGIEIGAAKIISGSYETGWENERAILFANEENRVIQNPNQGETAEISPAVAVGAACVIGVVSAATEVDRREDNKMKREPKRRKKKNIYSIRIDDEEEMGLKM